jgi:hypothetical protein
MKFVYLAVLGFGSMALAQELEPSPTESIGCVPHDDHWHCEGPRPTEAPEEVPEAPEEEVTLEPSPTESIGCEPHGDHWHCEGPRPTDAPEVTTTAEHDDEHEHTEDPGPSPTESIGCEPHGDHWHCEGPAPTDGPTEVPTEPEPTTTAADDHDDEHTEDAGPSPTESVGCEPHGDHWHCEGPAVTSDFSTVVTSVPTVPTGNGTIPTSIPEGGAAGLSAGFGVFAAAGAVAVILA